jgi:hypothetical protein
MRWRFGFAFGLLPLLCLVGLLPLRGSSAPQTPRTPPAAPSPEDIEFFEKKVRPLLAEQCVPCHSGAEPSGHLRLDRLAHLFGGAGGRALIAPGEPDKSILIHAVRYTVPALRMPPAGKLPADRIAVLEEWVKRGAPIPAEKAASSAPTPKATGFPLAERRKHWAYRPVVRPVVPKVKNAAWARNPIDAFLLQRLEAAGLKPAAPADKRTLLRRVTFDLTGLPPTPAEIDAFLNDTKPGAYERVVERLLASPAYGERWARHWLDLVRYGEGMGHEFDYEIPNAYQYRDYVIRALNADVPYDRFVREHIAGDLMAEPRYDPATGRNESVIATGFWWLGEGKHSPVDVKQEQADRIDNQIDVFGKAFLAQTVACARCHDHKFDPIPTKDYYALYGILKSSRYQQAHADAPARFAEPARRLDALHAAVPRPAVAAAWRAGLEAIPDARLQEAAAKTAPTPAATDAVLSDLTRWRPTGTAFAALGQSGDLALSEGERPGVRLLSRTAAHSGLRATRFEGALRSPTFTIDRDYLHLRLTGRKGRVHIVVESFGLIRDPIYGPLSWTVDNAVPAWRPVDMRLWKGRRAYIELSDSPLANLSVSDIAPANKPFDGWLRLDAVLRSDREKPTVRPNEMTGKTPSEIRAALSYALTRWERGALTPGDADALELLDALLHAGLLNTTPLTETARQMAAVEETIPVPTRVPAMCDGDGEDETVFLRGSYKTPGERAPRLNLALCFRESAATRKEAESGRRELAAGIASPRHPLTARVLVNRLWKHHFTVGIVASPDDFGHMGEKPTHPELLDWLASEFVRRGWSLKEMHRLMVLSSAYRMSSIPADPAAAKRKDPKNALLHAMPVRRLEAEAIRDAILSVSGRIDRTIYGPSIPVYLSEFSEGRGRPASGPQDGKGRRTLYLGVRRNFLSPWLLAFDFPTPFTTIGRRTVSNVPSQALALMNGPFVWEQAQVWAARLERELPAATTEARIARLYETAFGRPTTAAETAEAKAFLGDRPAPGDWSDFCHVLFNVKEFVYVR